MEVNALILANFWCDHRLRLDDFDEMLGDHFIPEIIIGNNVVINKDYHIVAINKIIIGDNVLITSKVYIPDHSHGEINRQVLNFLSAQRLIYSKGEIVLE